jgi:hypothetical protein
VRESLQREEQSLEQTDRQLQELELSYASRFQNEDSTQCTINETLNVFLCFLCGDRFKEEHSLKTHMKLEHLSKNKRQNPRPFVNVISSERKRVSSEPTAVLESIPTSSAESGFSSNGSSTPPRPSSSQSSVSALSVNAEYSPLSLRPRFDKTCPVCSLSCASIQSVKRHVQRKHPDRVDECKRVYRRDDMLSLPFACDICGKSFATAVYLQSHRRRHLVGKPFGCDLCDRSYTLLSELRKHIKSKHPENVESALEALKNRKKPAKSKKVESDTDDDMSDSLSCEL